MNPIIRWTENELVTEIDSLEEMLEHAHKGPDRAAKCARAYLKQLLRDRRETLGLLRHRRRPEREGPYRPLMSRRPEVRVLHGI